MNSRYPNLKNNPIAQKINEYFATHTAEQVADSLIEAQKDWKEKTKEVVDEVQKEKLSTFITSFDKMEDLSAEVAELHSLKQSIIESGLFNFAPKKEGLSFHDKVVFAIANLLEWKKELINLTPGGSEFVDDASYCSKFVKETIDDQHKTIIKLIKESKCL